MRRSLRKRLNSIGFLSLLLSSLILAAALFSIQMDIDEYHTNKQEPAFTSRAHQEVSEHEVRILGIGAEGWTAIFTGLLFLATGGLFFYTYALFQVAARESSKSEEALSTARAAALASSMQAKAAISASRAHMRFSDINIYANDLFDRAVSLAGEAPLYKIDVFAEITNYGTSPADVHSIRVAAVLAQRCSREDFKSWSVFSSIAWRPKTVKGEDKPTSFHQEIFLECDDFRYDDLLNKRIHLFIRIGVYYLDVFGKDQVEDVIWKFYSMTGGKSRRAPVAIDTYRGEDE